MTAKPKSLREAAIDVLRDRGPMHYQALTEEILSQGLAVSTSQTPAASLNAVIAIDIKRKGAKSDFVRVRSGVFGLRALHGEPSSLVPPDSSTPDVPEGVDPGVDESNQRVRTPLFPTYSEVRHVLRVWAGRPRKQVAGLRAVLNELRGTPQNTVNWTDPDHWIPERLEGDDRELALAIWRETRGAVNPRHTYGHWLLTQQYHLLEDDSEGSLCLTAAGREFLEQEGGETEAWLDEQEGVGKLLELVAENGPTRAGGLRDEWIEYLSQHSKFASPSTYRDTMRRRLANLVDRGYVSRTGTMYSATEPGLTYLKSLGGGGEGGEEQLWKLVRQQEKTVRESLLELLLDLDSIAFEHLVKRLLEEMDYQNVVVTSPSNDGGVDVIAEIELGITSVREVVQAKRHKRTIQRKDLDALRGSLYRFNAVRGTIIATSRFSSGTEEAAFATGAAPITLIDGDKLVDLLIEHGIGVRKKTVEILEVDPEAFADLGPEA